MQKPFDVRRRDSWQRQETPKRTKKSSWQRVSGVCQISAFSALNIAKETLFIDLTLCQNGNCEENGSLTAVTCWHLYLCSLFGSGDSMWTGWLHECPINWQHRQDIELGQMFVLSAWQSLLNAFQCSALSGERISGRLNTAASETKPSSHYKVWGVWKTPAFSALDIAKETLFIDLTLCQVTWMVLSQWSLLDTCICACLFGTDDWSELDSCTNVPSINGQHRQGIELRQGMAKARKSYLMFGDVIPGNDTIPQSEPNKFCDKGSQISGF